MGRGGSGRSSGSYSGGYGQPHNTRQSRRSGGKGGVGTSDDGNRGGYGHRGGHQQANNAGQPQRHGGKGGAGRSVDGHRRGYGHAHSAGHPHRAGEVAGPRVSSNRGHNGIKFVDPLDIKFSQDSISPTFKDGTPVKDTEAMLRSGAMRKRDVPLVKVTRQGDGQLWAHDHRRLHVFQELRRSGDCGRIKVEVTDTPVPNFKKSTRNGGSSIHAKKLPKEQVVTGWQYSAMPPSEYMYIGKNDSGEPMYLTDSVRKEAPTCWDLEYMMNQW